MREKTRRRPRAQGCSPPGTERASAGRHVVRVGTHRVVSSLSRSCRLRVHVRAGGSSRSGTAASRRECLGAPGLSRRAARAPDAAASQPVSQYTSRAACFWSGFPGVRRSRSDRRVCRSQTIRTRARMGSKVSGRAVSHRRRARRATPIRRRGRRAVPSAADVRPTQAPHRRFFGAAEQTSAERAAPCALWISEGASSVGERETAAPTPVFADPCFCCERALPPLLPATPNPCSCGASNRPKAMPCPRPQARLHSAPTLVHTAAQTHGPQTSKATSPCPPRPSS